MEDGRWKMESHTYTLCTLPPCRIAEIPPLVTHPCSTLSINLIFFWGRITSDPRSFRDKKRASPQYSIPLTLINQFLECTYYCDFCTGEGRSYVISEYPNLEFCFSFVKESIWGTCMYVYRAKGFHFLYLSKI